MGPYFEMRTYTYAPGELPTMIKNWENAIDGRLKFGPVCAIWYSELGALNKFVHIWPYQSLDAAHRDPQEIPRHRRVAVLGESDQGRRPG